MAPFMHKERIKYLLLLYQLNVKLNYIHGNFLSVSILLDVNWVLNNSILSQMSTTFSKKVTIAEKKTGSILNTGSTAVQKKKGFK
jgi:hypothetical protein